MPNYWGLGWKNSAISSGFLFLVFGRNLETKIIPTAEKLAKNLVAML